MLGAVVATALVLAGVLELYVGVFVSVHRFLLLRRRSLYKLTRLARAEVEGRVVKALLALQQPGEDILLQDSAVPWFSLTRIQRWHLAWLSPTVAK